LTIRFTLLLTAARSRGISPNRFLF